MATETVVGSIRDIGIGNEGHMFQRPLMLDHSSSIEPSIGRIVHYVLSTEDIARINLSRDKKWYGNSVKIGDKFPMMIVNVCTNESGKNRRCVNGQVFLDGNDMFWVREVPQGIASGEWRWPV